MNTLVVGDLHGDWSSLNQLINKKQPNLVLQCGDFGHWPALEYLKRNLYRDKSPWKLQGVKAQDAHVLWCDGNHEDHWHLREHNVNYQGVTYMPRGSVRMLTDQRMVMFVGGAESVDKSSRTLGIDWFPEEVISWAESESIVEYGGPVDIVISHTCPLEFDIPGKPDKHSDPTRMTLSWVLNKYKPDLWYFGHWHTNVRGKYRNTRWECLDYPHHAGGKWWTWLK